MAIWKSNRPANGTNQSLLRTCVLLVLAVFCVFLSGCSIAGPGVVQPDVATLSEQYHANQFPQQPSIGLDSGSQSFAGQAVGHLVSQADEMISPSRNSLPSSDLSPLEFAPNVGQSQPGDEGAVVQEKMTKELFDWSGKDGAVVKSMKQNPIQRVTNADYFVESSDQNGKQRTRKTYSVMPAAKEWISEAMNDN